jgi:tetratricopeptide (TPR) repeat protein
VPLLPFILLLAALLRLWAIDFGLPNWLHPDEFSFVFLPLNFYSGDLNPHFFTYPTLHYYLLALLYGLYFLLQKFFGAGLSLEEFLALHYFWDRVELMRLARLSSALLGLATVAWTAALARSLQGPRAGYLAGALLAVGAVHVRQSHLAGVDAAMTLWYTGAVWASVRLLKKETLQDYLLAGALVGLAASTKYPGALAAGAVLAAHFLARRSLFDQRLWAAGAVSLGCFLLLSPYALLDFAAFSTYFLHQAAHLEAGHGPSLGRGWWYHLHFTLVRNSGWPALLLLAAAAVEVVRQRQAGGAVVLAAFLVFHAAMGYGQTVFARYALPLMPLQAALAAALLARIRNGRYLALAAALVLAQPLYASWTMVRLMGQEDTRVQARAWIEAHVPAGTAMGNFGGWAGDVPLRTFEQLWWELSHYERVFGRQRLELALDFLERLGPPSPFYSYAIQRSNLEAERGSLEEIERLETTWVVLHRHPLSYSRVDSAFAQRLAERAELQAGFAPAGLWEEGIGYDPVDALYVPLSGSQKLDRPGPQIEVWRMRQYPVEPLRPRTVREIFAQAHVRGAASALGQGRSEEAIALAQRALELDPRCGDAWFALGAMYQKGAELHLAEQCYLRQVRLQPPLRSASTLHNLGMIYEAQSRVEEAERAYQEALQSAPWKWASARSLAEFYRRQGKLDQAIARYQEQAGRFAEKTELWENLGRALEQAGRKTEAGGAYARALGLGGAQEQTYLHLAYLLGAERRYAEVVAVCQALLERNARQAEAHRLLAHIYRYQGETAKARQHGRAYVELEPGGEEAALMRSWLEESP